MASLTEKLESLNQVDLSGLKKKIKEALSEKINSDLIAKNTQTAGLSADEFMTALERAKKMGLI